MRRKCDGGCYGVTILEPPQKRVKPNSYKR